MRTALKFLIVVFLTTSLTSCEWIKGLSDVEIDTVIEGQLDIVTDEAELKSTDAHGFYGTETVDVLNDDLVEYADLIEAFNTRSITLEVASVDSAGFPITGVMILTGSEFSLSSTSHPGYVWSLMADMSVEVGNTLSLDADDYSAINDVLESGDPVTFVADGTCNNGNIFITFNYSIDVMVEANPLD